MASTPDLLLRCRRSVASTDLLEHEFFQALKAEGEVGRRALVAWSCEDYWVARAFPSLLGHLIAHTFDAAARHVLIKNLWEEAGRGNLDAAHFSLYRSFLSSIGVPVPGTDDRPRPCEFIDIQAELARTDPVLAVAVFCYASEYLCLFEFEPITLAVQRYFPQADTRYLQEIRVDARHTRELEGGLSQMLGPDYDGRRDDEIVEAVELAIDARRSLYDRVMQVVREGQRVST